MGKSWTELAQVFNILTGNLMLLVLVVSGTAPYLAAKLCIPKTDPPSFPGIKRLSSRGDGLNQNGQ